MLRTKIKASAITNLTDARYFAAFHVDYLGFNLEIGTPDAISATETKAIKEWVEGPKIVGEFGNMPLASVQQGIDLLGFDLVQVGHFADKAMIEAIHIPVIKEVIWHPDTKLDTLVAELELLAPHVAYFLLDFSKNNLTWTDLQVGKPIDLAALQGLCKRFPVLLDLSFKAEELEDLLELDIAGLSLKGGEEEMVGYKSYDELDTLFEVLEIEEAF